MAVCLVCHISVLGGILTRHETRNRRRNSYRLEKDGNTHRSAERALRRGASEAAGAVRNICGYAGCDATNNDGRMRPPTPVGCRADAC